MDPFEHDSIAARLAPKSPNAALYESFGLTLLGFGMGYLLQPNDPLFTAEGFPWPILIPVLAGLRYGFAQAFIVALALHVAGFFFTFHNPTAPWPLPFGYSLGMLILSMLVGEFRDIWEQRIENLSQSNMYRQARLEEFTRAYHILKMSHDRLEQANAGDGTSLRSALLDLRSMAYAKKPLEELSQALLDMLSTYCTVEAATVIKTKGRLMPELDTTLGSIGKVNEVDPKDLLVDMSLRMRQTASVDMENQETMRNRQPGDPLVAVPLLDAYRQIHGVVVVTGLPFFSFNERNLQLMSLVAGEMADFLGADMALPKDTPEAEADLILQVRRCISNAQLYGLHSALLGITFKDQTSVLALMDTIAKETRGLDVIHKVEVDGDWKLFLLMPLASREGIDQFSIRFNSYLARQHGNNAGGLGIEYLHYVITPEVEVADTARFVSELVGTEHRIAQLIALEPSEDEADVDPAADVQDQSA